MKIISELEITTSFNIPNASKQLLTCVAIINEGHISFVDTDLEQFASIQFNSEQEALDYINEHFVVNE